MSQNKNRENQFWLESDGISTMLTMNPLEIFNIKRNPT